MLKMLVTSINSFECPFICPCKKLPPTEELFLYNIGCKYVKERKNIIALYLKILKKRVIK